MSNEAINTKDMSDSVPNNQMTCEVQGPILRKLSDCDFVDNKKFKPLNEQLLFTGNSLQLSKYTFEDNLGNEKSAEIIKKMHKIGNNTADDTVSVLTVAILRRHILCDCLLLVKQYRPTLKSYVLEFPANEHQFDSTDDKTKEVAIQDVENNTGYKSTDIRYISPETALDPELCDAKSRLVSLIIDGDDPIKNGFINGHHNEKHSGLEVHQVPINGLLDRLNEYDKHGVIVDSRVYAFAIGLKKGEKLAQLPVKPENIENV